MLVLLEACLNAVVCALQIALNKFASPLNSYPLFDGVVALREAPV